MRRPDAAEAAALAGRIVKAPGLIFGGLLNYPKSGAAAAVQGFLAEALSLLDKAGIPCPVVSNGGTPSLFEAHLVTAATKHRAGTYIYDDRSMVRSGHCSEDECAMHVLATVVSCPTAERAVIDAGSKALTLDLLAFANFGTVADYPEAVINGLSEEHGVIDLSACPGMRPEIGDKIGSFQTIPA